MESDAEAPANDNNAAFAEVVKPVVVRAGTVEVAVVA